MTQFVPITTSDVVALRKESVDRNILSKSAMVTSLLVALRKESVDRNHDDMLRYRDAEVALRKESVDRNTALVRRSRAANLCRSPQGERG